MNKHATTGIEVKLLRYKCIGCMYCISIAPEIFSISPQDGKVTEVGEENIDIDITTFIAPLDYRTPLEQSVNICPVKAIVIKI